MDEYVDYFYGMVAPLSPMERLKSKFEDVPQIFKFVTFWGGALILVRKVLTN